MNAVSHRERIRRGTSRILLASLLAGALTGCVEQSMSDLEAYTQQVLARKGSRVDELPPIEPYEVYTYSSSDGVDPFEPFYKEVTPEQGTQGPLASGSGISPNFDRNKEELESFALDSLRMMGTLEAQEKLWGIVRSPDGTIHRVKVGNYMGRNHGKIVGISEESINLNEIVQNGQGGWQERDASLALVEQ
jgi:type IV pilus assembly protein PilP